METMRITQEELRQSGEKIERGGYIFVDLLDEEKSLFYDLLKGFEEYALLKGYRIVFSIDNTVPHKVAFKFTLMDPGINVSIAKVKKDIQEYISKIEQGDTLDDLPVVLPLEEHQLLLTAMKKRIEFLQYKYNLKKDIEAFYERFLDKLISTNRGIFPAPNINIQTGGELTMGDKHVGRDYIELSEKAHVASLTTGSGDSFQGDYALKLLQSTTPQSPQMDILKLLSFVQHEIPKLPIPKSLKEELINEVKGAEIQAKKNPPDKEKISGKLKNATEILKETVQTVKEAATLGNLLGKAILWCGDQWVKWI
jgi:hypothetical protein